MIAHLRGFLTILVLMGLVSAIFRVTLASESTLIMFAVGASSAVIFGVAAWNSHKFFSAKLSYWSLAAATFTVALVREIYPIDYDTGLG